MGVSLHHQNSEFKKYTNNVPDAGNMEPFKIASISNK